MKKILGAILVAVVGFTAASVIADASPGRVFRGTVEHFLTQEPVAGARITLLRLDEPGLSRDTGSSVNGEFSFDGLEPGRYELRVSAEGFGPVRDWFQVQHSGSETPEIEARVQLRPAAGLDEPRRGLTLLDADRVRRLSDGDLNRLGRVEGTVRSDQRVGLDYANVVLIRDSDGLLWGAMTMDGGRFSLPAIPPGEYTLKVLYLGYKPVEKSVLVEDATTSSFAFDLEVTTVKEFDVIATEGAAVMVDSDELQKRQIAGSQGLTDYAVDRVEESVARQAAPSGPDGKDFVRGGRSGAVSFSVGGLSPGTPSAEVLERLAGDADEVWILERPGGRRPADPDAHPGTGCLVVIEEDREIPVPLEHTDVHARIDGYVASVDVRQRFHNPFDETIEAEYVFPLPHDAAVNDFLMVIGERRIRGIIREKEEARELYEQARRMGHVASLLEQERPNIFRQRVANIEPGHAIEVELHYFNALPYRDGEFEFAFPLVVGPRFNPPGSQDPIEALPRGAQPAGTGVTYLAPGERSGHDVDITVELDAGLRVRDLESLNHGVRVTRQGREAALVRLNRHDRIPNKDFVLRYRVADEDVTSAILTHREGDEGYFTMMLVPPASLEKLRRAPVEFVFVLDCSGSMNGWPMEKAKSAMRRALKQLDEGDSFQIVRFSENASALGPEPVEATPQNVRRGLDYVERLSGSGGTMMIEGIKAALEFPRDPGRQRIVSFMTDGYIGNEAEIFGAIAERLGDTRIFSFGVGNSVNRHLIEGMARMGRGAVAYIGLDDDLDAVDQFYQAVRHPALTDIRIDWGGMRVAQVFPRRAQDLFVGRPVLMHGRYEASGRTTVTVSGSAGGRRVEMEIDVDLDDGVRREALPLLWARSEIGHISDQLAREADAALEERGLELALDYNLVSDWTSFVAIDASQVVDEPGDRTERVPVPVPEGVKYDTTVRQRGRQE